MKQMVTVEQIQKIIDAYEATRGTAEWIRYTLCHEYKDVNGRWKYLGYSLPRLEEGSYIKKVREYYYIMQKAGFVDYSERYCLTKAAAELIGFDMEE